MTLQQIIYVVTTADLGSMNKAAERLFVSQPTLTGAIRELEKELNITVFTRTGRGVIPTGDGEEFLIYARQVYQQYQLLKDRYTDGKDVKRRFGISTQHYSFAVKAFVETVKQFDTQKYELAIREEKTREIINDVSCLKSEIGIIYQNDFNRKIISKLLRDNDLTFHPIITCNAYVYLWKGHPLANKKSIRFSELEDYPCLSFEQGDNGSFYFAEEILSTNEYKRTIKATDRATLLNLMVGLNGYTLCSGIICEELNGSDYTAIPFESDTENPNSTMEIGYILKKNNILSAIGETYINEITKYLSPKNSD